MNSRLLFNRLLSLVLMFLVLVSCAADTYNNDEFLFFIDVDDEATALACAWALIVQGAAIYFSRFYRTKSGWRRKAIQRDIYDNRGDKIGSYDTGEYDQWFVSEEKAEKETTLIQLWAWIVRISYPRVFLVSCIASWVLTNHVFWIIVVCLAIAPFWIYKRYKKGQEATGYIIPEVIYMIILLVCCIVYW